MSVKNSNILGVYVQSGSTATEAISEVINTTSGTISAHDFTGVADGNYILVNEIVGFAAFVTVSSEVGSEMPLELAGCATNTSLDISNSINETVCRDGSGASSRHIVSGATTWSVSVDGLFGASGTDADAFDLVDLANANAYVIVKFSTDVTGTSTDYVGQALLESVNISGGVDDISTYSCSLSGQGKLYKSLA